MSMNFTSNFRGASGTAYAFDEVDRDSAWASEPGVALFAAPDAFGWRIIRMIEIGGRDHDIRPLLALADAERYGATTVFTTPGESREMRRAVLEDLSDGLTPVCTTHADIRVHVPVAA